MTTPTPQMRTRAGTQGLTCRWRSAWWPSAREAWPPNDWVFSVAPQLGTLCSVRYLPECPPLCVPCTIRASQETAISGSGQPAPVGTHNSVWVCNCVENASLGGAVSGWSFPQTLLKLLSLYLLLWVFFPLSTKDARIHT